MTRTTRGKLYPKRRRALQFDAMAFGVHSTLKKSLDRSRDWLSFYRFQMQLGFYLIKYKWRRKEVLESIYQRARTRYYNIHTQGRHRVLQALKGSINYSPSNLARMIQPPFQIRAHSPRLTFHPFFSDAALMIPRPCA